VEIRVSRGLVRRFTLLLLLPVSIAGLTILGRSVTPRDAADTPLLLSPALKSTLEYRAHARHLVRELHSLDEELEALLNSHTDIYQQSQSVNSMMDEALRLAKQVEISRAPAALASLRMSLSHTSLAYVDAAQATADWLGEPMPERERSILEALAAARRLLAHVEDSRWLEESEAQPMGDFQQENGDGLWATQVP
jgi:hypothetical protein